MIYKVLLGFIKYNINDHLPRLIFGLGRYYYYHYSLVKENLNMHFWKFQGQKTFNG